jgi:hypothetical protein
MCGLSVEYINSKGGININKFLAYLALCNGATEEFRNFNIDKTVVVDDFTTDVFGEVDYIDPKTYKINRKKMEVPVTHTDGCGMMLPKVSRKNFMVRLPWVKGLLSPFAFDEFCREHRLSGDITDIYGRKYNIFDDGIEVIFTKSQFKMWKYYDSWKDYTAKYKSNKCKAGKCNEDENYVRNAKFNYQMLQTLSDITDDELNIITEKSRNDILNISSDRQTMLKVFGAVSCRQNKNPFQQALELYPEMLADVYTKEVLKMIKKKLVRNGRSGKFGINGKYTFIIPDLYAFCGRLFAGTDVPDGLLADGEVYCGMFPGNAELDCLRSPHLYREHAVRSNSVNAVSRKWFITNGLYTSSHDLISKLLMFDVDGDKSLVCADKTVINAAKRNMNGIVPLYYEMGTAEPAAVSGNSLYSGLTFAFANCNIGAVSNDITKIWNGNDVNLDVIKLLAMENNFIIDAAKTLTKLERPKEMKPIIGRYARNKLPKFFIYAKDKTPEQVESVNGSPVNRLDKFIPNKRVMFDKHVFGMFEYKMLMSDPNVEIDRKFVAEYDKMKMDNRFNMNICDEHSNVYYIYLENRKRLLELCENSTVAADMLVKYLYAEMKSKHKEALWEIFGNELLENLKRNLKERYGNDFILCQGCAERVAKNSNRQKYCDSCAERIKKEQTKNRVKKNRKSYDYAHKSGSTA